MREKEAALRLGVSISLLRSWRQRRTVIPYVKAGRCILYRVKDIEELIDRRVNEALDFKYTKRVYSGSRRYYREVAAKALGRRLKGDEVVHHINGDHNDNRNCNLLICTNAYHQWLHREMSRRFARKLLGVNR